MLDGRLQQFDAPQTVYRTPANRFVAGFIGTPSMNLIDGEIAMQDGRWVFNAPGLTLTPGPLAPDAVAGPACIGVRPDHVTLGTGPIQGVVQLVEQTGHESIVVVRLGDGVRVTGRAPASQQWRMGEPIAIGLDAREAHVFGPGPTGPRLNRLDQTAGLADGPERDLGAP
jgi:ABC-type sugar transport system ATPase subunit